MLKTVFRITLLCCLVAGAFYVMPQYADAESKVYRKTPKKEVVEELFVTSW